MAEKYTGYCRKYEDQCSGSFARTRQLAASFMQGLAGDAGKTRWCEKTPLNAYHIAFIHAVFPDARYICLHRQPLDAIRSTIQSGLMEQSIATWKYSDRDILNMVTERWCEWTERILAFEKVHAASCLRIKYEELVGNTDATIDKVLTFADLTLTPGLARHAFETRHVDGVGDFKWFDTKGIETGHIGNGLALDISAVPAGLRHRLVGLLDALDY